MTLGNAWKVLGKPQPPFYFRDRTGAARVKSIDFGDEGVVFYVYYATKNVEKYVTIDHVITVLTVD